MRRVWTREEIAARVDELHAALEETRNRGTCALRGAFSEGDGYDRGRPLFRSLVRLPRR